MTVRSYVRTCHSGAFPPHGLKPGGFHAPSYTVSPWLILPALVAAVMVRCTIHAVAAWREQSQHAQRLAHRLERLQATATAMVAAPNTEQLLQTLSARLAALFDASASWAVLLEPDGARLITTCCKLPTIPWNALTYAEALQAQQVRQYRGAEIARLHPLAPVPWEALVLIPLAIEGRLLGGIVLASAAPLALSDDDRRVLLTFAAHAALSVEHARLFAALQHNQHELARSSKLAALGTFSAGIGHEFNNLLAGIMGFAELGLLSDNLADKNEALDVALNACRRGQRITSGLLTFARRDEAHAGLHVIQKLVDETLLLVEHELTKANIAIERRYRPVPPVLCTPGQIAQVVMHLVTNARDAMPQGGGGTISVELTQRDGWAELVVRDTGSGIPAALLDQMFQPFTTTKGALGGSSIFGTGLGLAICHGIMQSHHGTIAIRSSEGAGTAVTVRLPLAPADGGSAALTVGDAPRALAARDELVANVVP